MKRGAYFLKQRNHSSIINTFIVKNSHIEFLSDTSENKYLKRFTEIVFYTNEIEFDYYSKLLLKCGFTKLGNRTFSSSEGFKLSFEPFKHGSKYSIKSIRFETNKISYQQITVSDHIQINFMGKEGKIDFN